jgi:hypothetical protein
MIVLLLVLAPHGGRAFSVTTGKHLLQYAKEWKKNEEGRKASAAEVGFYFGYVWGMAESLYFAKSVHIPKTASRDRLERIVFQYLQSHPSELHYPACILIEDAFRKAFSR